MGRVQLLEPTHVVEHGIRGGIGQLVGDATIGEEDHTVRVAGRDRVVGDHDDRLAELAHGVAHEREDLGARGAVEVAGRLVGEDDLRPARQARGRRRRAVAGRRTARSGRCLQAVGQSDGGDHVVDPVAVGLAAGEVHRQRDVLDRGQRRHEVERLEDEAQAVAPQPGELLFAGGGDVDVADGDRAAGEAIEAGHAVHEGRLAGAGRAHDGGELAGGEVDVDVVEGEDLGVAGAVRLGGAAGRSGATVVG